MKPGRDQSVPLLDRPSPELRMKIRKRAQTQPRPLDGRSCRHVSVDEEPNTGDLMEILEQQHEPCATSSCGVHARHPNRDPRSDPLAEAGFDFPEANRIREGTRAEFWTGKLDVCRPRKLLIRCGVLFENSSSTRKFVQLLLSNWTPGSETDRT